MGRSKCRSRNGATITKDDLKLGANIHQTMTNFTSFILRCWYSFRGPDEGAECRDIRHKFANAEFVDMLPKRVQKLDMKTALKIASGEISTERAQKMVCSKPIFIVNGVHGPGRKDGEFIVGNKKSLTHIRERWHRCCLPMRLATPEEIEKKDYRIEKPIMPDLSNNGANGAIGETAEADTGVNIAGGNSHLSETRKKLDKIGFVEIGGQDEEMFKAARMMCEQVKLVDRPTLMGLYGGRCGKTPCHGHRDRCLETSEFYEYRESGNEPVYSPECPSNCPSDCIKAYSKRECIYEGLEPVDGYEGNSNPKSPFDGNPEPYRVVDIGEEESMNAKPLQGASGESAIKKSVRESEARRWGESWLPGWTWT